MLDSGVQQSGSEIYISLLLIYILFHILFCYDLLQDIEYMDICIWQRTSEDPNQCLLVWFQVSLWSGPSLPHPTIFPSGLLTLCFIQVGFLTPICLPSLRGCPCPELPFALFPLILCAQFPLILLPTQIHFPCLWGLVHLLSSVSFPDHSGPHWSLLPETLQHVGSMLSKTMEIIFSVILFVLINLFITISNKWL